MAEEIKDNCKRYPEPTVGPIIYNDQGEILLIQSPKWGEYWHIPGGHVEIGETCEQALKREIIEETGLEIDNIEFIGWQDAINLENFHKKKHFIFLDYCARVSGGKIIKSREMEAYIWIHPEEAMKTLKIDPATVTTIKFYLKHIEKKANSCKNGSPDASSLEASADRKAMEDKSFSAKALEDKYKRALADYQNLLKQTAKEKMEFAMFANEAMLKEILPVYDHLKMAIEHHNGESSDEWITGVKHVVKQFRDVLEKIGVEEVKTVGEKFDHNSMEAIQNEATDDNKLDGRVAKQMKAGYKLNGKVIEAAKVVVYKVKS